MKSEKKGSGLPAYDVRAVFERIPEITGMELVRKGEQWQGRYYINGERHQWRRDKLKFYKFNRGVWVTEEGGATMSITTWLQNCGGASDYWDAVRILKGVRCPMFAIPESAMRKVEVRYVGEDVYKAARQWNVDRCPLFQWMCSLFPEENVRRAWDLYGVTTDMKGRAVFWYRDVDGRICHDKIIPYAENGHRIKTAMMGRNYKVGEGYSGRCFFGSHLMGEEKRIYVCESEKSAIMSYLYTGVVTVATGGKNNLREKDDRFLLLPDLDAIEEWSNTGNIVVDWWKGWKTQDEHADVCDLIESIRKNQ